MSQYHAVGKDGVTYLYGYDRQTREFFLNNGEEEFVGCLCDVPGTYSNLVDKIEEFGLDVPAEHLRHIFADTPF